jgi:hypothetical protein
VKGTNVKNPSRGWSQGGGRIPREALYLAVIAVVVLTVSGGVPEFRAYEWTLWAIFGLLAASFAFVWGGLTPDLGHAESSIVLGKRDDPVHGQEELHRRVPSAGR